MLKEALAPSQEVNIIPWQNCVKSLRARRKPPPANSNTPSGNAMTGQSSSQAATPVRMVETRTLLRGYCRPLVCEMAAVLR